MCPYSQYIPQAGPLLCIGITAPEENLADCEFLCDEDMQKRGHSGEGVEVAKVCGICSCILLQVGRGREGGVLEMTDSRWTPRDMSDY